MNPAIGVLVMAYGTPSSTDEVLAYYTDIRRGSPPTDEQLADLIRRYAAIGGVSPLAHHTQSQCDVIQGELDIIAPGRYHAIVGTKHSNPRIESAFGQLVAAGVGRVIGIVLAPHYSQFSIGKYFELLHAAAGGSAVSLASVESWATEPAFVDFLANNITEQLAVMPPRTRVLFTAHSLPERIVAAGDPYVDELRSTAEAVASAVGLTEGSQWSIAWQSRGRTPEPWLEPDILTVIDELAKDKSVDGVLVCACGFVADHLEVLYDLDIEACQRAESQGLVFDRTACVNDNSTVLSALAARVHTAAS